MIIMHLSLLFLASSVLGVSVDPDMDLIMMEQEVPMQSESEDVFLYSNLLPNNPLSLVSVNNIIILSKLRSCWGGRGFITTNSSSCRCLKFDGLGESFELSRGTNIKISNLDTNFYNSLILLSLDLNSIITE